MRSKYKTSFDSISVNNRWKMPYYSRTEDWTIIGISEKWFSPTLWRIGFSFFGIDVNVWFKRNYTHKHENKTA